MKRHLITAALAVSFCAGLVWWADGRGYARANAACASAAAEAQAQQLIKTKRMIRDVDALAQNLETENSVLAADVDRLAAAAGGLRAALASRAGGDTAAPSGGDDGPVGRALAQCVDRYSELAGIADGYANQLRALQGWANVVAPPE